MLRQDNVTVRFVTDNSSTTALASPSEIWRFKNGDYIPTKNLTLQTQNYLLSPGRKWGTL